jgi:hypothetical protein
MYPWAPIKVFRGKALIFGSAPAVEFENALCHLRFDITKCLDKLKETLNSGILKVL